MTTMNRRLGRPCPLSILASTLSLPDSVTWSSTVAPAKRFSATPFARAVRDPFDRRRRPAGSRVLRSWRYLTGEGCSSMNSLSWSNRRSVIMAFHA